MRRRRRWRRSASSGRWLASSMRTRSTVDVNLRAEAAAEVLSVSADAEVVVAARPPRRRDEVERAGGRRDRDRVGGGEVDPTGRGEARTGQLLRSALSMARRIQALTEIPPAAANLATSSAVPAGRATEHLSGLRGIATACRLDRTRALGSQDRRSARRPSRRRCSSCGRRVRHGFLDLESEGVRHVLEAVETHAGVQRRFVPLDLLLLQTETLARAVAASGPLRSAPR